MGDRRKGIGHEFSKGGGEEQKREDSSWGGVKHFRKNLKGALGMRGGEGGVRGEEVCLTQREEGIWLSL